MITIITLHYYQIPVTLFNKVPALFPPKNTVTYHISQQRFDDGGLALGGVPTEVVCQVVWGEGGGRQHPPPQEVEHVRVVRGR